MKDVVLTDKTYFAQDQYGRTHHDLGRHPRKKLLELYGRKHAERMYVDRKGQRFHVGYIIAGHWLRVFEVVDFARPA